MDQSSVHWQVVLLAVVGVGCALWLLGSRVTRPACAIAGLFAGGVGGLVVWRELGEPGASSVWVITGSVAGFLLAIATVRLWVGIGGGALCALAVAVATLVWQGADLSLDPGGIVNAQAPGDTASAEDRPGPLPDRAVWLCTQIRRQASVWWDRHGKSGRRNLLIAACAGALVGLVLGLVYPDRMATFASELVGSAMVVLGVKALVALNLPGAALWLPTGPRSLLVLIGLITLVGCLVQWTFFNPKADS